MSDVSVSLFYQVRVQDSVHMIVELCYACAYFEHNCEHSIESCNNRYTGKLQKKKTNRWCASETIIMIIFHHPLLSLLSFKEIDDQNLKK